MSLTRVDLPKKSTLYEWFFDLYTRVLLKIRFAKVDVCLDYEPKGKKTIYYGNHCYWWDALIPLVINRKYTQQDLRAIMEQKQMEEWPFFSKIGAIPIEKGSRTSLKRLLDMLDTHFKHHNSCLWIYPEGKMTSTMDTPAPFESLIGLLAAKYPDVDLVCVAQYIDLSKSNKPNLHIRFKPIDRSQLPQKRTHINQYLRQQNKAALQDLSLKLYS